MLWANRNGFFYVLDRVTGQFLLGKPFVKQNWALGFDNGRPVRAPGIKPSPEGTLVQPGTQGGTNWSSPSFSPRTGLFYLSVWDNYSAVSRYTDVPAWREGRKYTGQAGRSAAAGRARGSDNLPRGSRLSHRGRGLRRVAGARPEDRREEVGIQDGRLHRERSADDGVGPGVLGRAGGLLLRARRADGRTALAGESRGEHRQRADLVTRSTGVGTSPSLRKGPCPCFGLLQ